MARLANTRATRCHPGRWADQSGLTLVEMLVSLLILGLVLSALAGSIVASLRAISDNERTAAGATLHTEVIEQLQSLEWSDAVLYQAELDRLSSYGLSSSDANPTFDGLDVVVIPGPASAADRRAFVPEPTSTVNRGGVEYDIDRILVWVDRDNDLINDTKRFISFVTWPDGRIGTTTTRVESERVPVGADNVASGSGIRVLQFDVGPDPARLHTANAPYAGHSDSHARDSNVAPIEVIARFSEGMDFAKLDFYRLDVLDLLTQETIFLTGSSEEPAGSGKFTEWSTTIPAGAYRFPNGQRTFGLTGVRNSLAVGTTASVEFRDGTLPEAPDPVASPSPTVPPSPSPSPTGTPSPGVSPAPEDVRLVPDSVGVNGPICVDKQTDRLIKALTVTVTVQGLTPTDGGVTVTYTHFPGGKAVTQTSNMVPSGSIVSSGTIFTFTRPVGSGDPVFSPPTGNTVQTSFFVEASRPSDGQSAAKSSASITIDAKC